MPAGAPGPLSAQGMLALQQSAGNVAVQSLFPRLDGAPGTARRRTEPASQLPQTSGRQPLRPAAEPVALVQRHSSWEHQLLGDAKPEDMAKIGTWQDLIEQTKLEGRPGFRTRKKDTAEVTVDLSTPKQPGPVKVTKGNVLHIIDQHLTLLDEWQKSPPTEHSGGQVDPTYHTILLSLPGGKADGSPLIVTYGEMNTLADYYGGLDVMKGADKEKRWMAVQSVRKETFFRLKSIYDQLVESLTSVEKQDAEVIASLSETDRMARFRQKHGKAFADATKYKYVSAMWGQIDLIKHGAGAAGSNEYAATLGRNACHFVPESWHAWASYHQKARDLAKEAADLTAKADYIEKQGGSKGAIESLRKEASDRVNEALVTNGFGDHYLQDSYASGHMINKTQIMQWFVQWLDTQPWKREFASDDQWRRVQAIAYRQPGLVDAIRAGSQASQYDKSRVEGASGKLPANRPRNPQAVEDIQGNDWKTRFDALGLKVPASLSTAGSDTRKLIDWWQEQAATAGGQELTGASLIESRKLGYTELLTALSALLADGVIWKSGQAAFKGGEKFMSGKQRITRSLSPGQFREIKFTLRKEYVPSGMKNLTKARKQLAKGKKGADDRFQRLFAEVTHQDYLRFLNNSYLQKSTNALHNEFCEKGLEVETDDGQPLFKVYGDDNMFNSQSALGVEHSTKTAHMSRDAIVSISQGDPKPVTADQILKRLPSKVKLAGGTSSIEDWHDPNAQDRLRNFCESVVFPGMDFASKLVGQFKGELSESISKDYKPHGDQVF